MRRFVFRARMSGQEEEDRWRRRRRSSKPISKQAFPYAAVVAIAAVYAVANPGDLTLTYPADGMLTGNDSVRVEGAVGNLRVETVLLSVNGTDREVAVRSGKFAIPAVELQPGLNRIQVRADAIGVPAIRKRAETTVYYGGRIRFTSPANGYVTTKEQVDVTGVVEQMPDAVGEITLTVNGIARREPIANNEFATTVRLKEGRNTIQATACNRGIDQPIQSGEINIIRTQTAPNQEVVTTVPPANATDVPPCMPSIFFLERNYDQDVEHAVYVTSDDGRTRVATQASRVLRLTGHSGNAIIIVAPGVRYQEGDEVHTQIFLERGTVVAELGYRVRRQERTELSGDSAPQRELLAAGLGDYSFAAEKAVPIKPVRGVSMIGFSSGKFFGGPAMEGKASALTIEPVDAGDRRPDRFVLRFQYDFISSEFDDFVGSEYDDAFLLVASGPRGASAYLMTSVNYVGKEKSTSVEKFADDENKQLEHTGWRRFERPLEVGSPTSLTFVVTDVGDAYRTTIVLLDAIEFE